MLPFIIKPAFWPIICLLWAVSSVLGQAIPYDGNDDLSTTEPLTVQSGEILFEDIELSPEGIVAYDSAGSRWTYDFGQDCFVYDPRSTVSDRFGAERSVEHETIEPVEDRCTEELVLGGTSLRTISVGIDEYVDGDVIAFGRVTIKGWVKGDVQSINKRVLVTASGQVDGNIRAPRIEIKDGGVVLGQQIVTDKFDLPVEIVRTSFSSDGLWVVFGLSVALLLMAFLASSLAPRQTANVSDCIKKYKARAFAVGVLFVFLMPFLVALLAITVVGILVVPFLPFAYLLSLAMGIGAFSHLVLQPVLLRRFGARPGLVLNSVAGVLFFMVLWMFVATLLGSSDSVSEGFGIFLLVISILLTLFPLMTGVGAVVLTRFGFREYVSFADHQADHDQTVPAPAPPPMKDDLPVPPPLNLPVVPPPPFSSPSQNSDDDK